MHHKAFGLRRGANCWRYRSIPLQGNASFGLRLLHFSTHVSTAKHVRLDAPLNAGAGWEVLALTLNLLQGALAQEGIFLSA